jgi:predicted RND superfamily exporter protein
MAGGPLTDQAFDLVAQRDMGTLVPMVLVVMIVVLGLLFRSLWVVGVAIGTALLAIAATLGLTGAFSYKLNTITVAIPHLLTGIAVATTLHVFSSFLTGKARGLDSKAAVKASLATNLVPILLTSVTTTIGFFGFLFATIVPVTRLGFMAGLGTLIIMVLSLTAVPALLSFYPERPRRSLDSFLEVRKRLHGFGQWIVRRTRPIILVWIGVALVAALGLPFAAVDSNPVGYFKSRYWFSQSVNFLEKQGSGGAVYEIVARGQGPESVKTVDYMEDLDRLSRYLLTEAPGQYSNVFSLSTVLRNINRALHGDDPAFHVVPSSHEAIAQFLLLYTLSVPVGQDINDRINVDYSASRLTVIRALTPTQESRRNIDAISRWAAENLQHVTIEFTGRDVLYTNLGNNVSTSLLRSLMFTVTLATLVIAVLFRSARIALVSLIPNALPLVLVVGVMGIGGILLDVGTIMGASMGFGIAVDDTIHSLVHYQTERKSGSDSSTAVAATLERIGIPICATTLALASAFLVFLMADFMPNFYFGLLLSLLLVFALAADLTLTPSVLHWLESRKARAGVAPASSAPEERTPGDGTLDAQTLPTLQGETR